MGRVAELGCRAVFLAADAAKFGRIDRVPTVVALIAARSVKPAVRAYAFDKPIRQESLFDQTERHALDALDQVTVVEEFLEHALSHGVMVFRVRVGIQVEGESHADVRLGKHVVVSLGEFPRGHAFLACGEHGRRAVHVAPGYHQDVVACEPVIPRKDVGGQAVARDMPEMRRAVYVRPRDGHKDPVSHVSSSQSAVQPISPKPVRAGLSSISSGGYSPEGSNPAPDTMR